MAGIEDFSSETGFCSFFTKFENFWEGVPLAYLSMESIVLEVLKKKFLLS